MESVIFPITPMGDNVIIKVSAEVSMLLNDSKNILNDADITHSIVSAIGSNVSNIKIGDNIIINPYATKTVVKVKDNDKDPMIVFDKSKKTKLIGQHTTTKEIVAYFIINQLDILAIDNQ